MFRFMLRRALTGSIGALLLGAALHTPAGAAERGLATFAGGCFWCMEEAFDAVPGVLITTSGYTGGSEKGPTYEEVSTGTTGHYEAVRVVFDPEQVSYQDLLVTFWRNIDLLDADGQFCDRGPQYRAAIFVHDEAQQRLAEESRHFLDVNAGFERPIVTPTGRVGIFHPAEEEHQDYHRKNPIRYKVYKQRCGRAARLQQLWSNR